MNGKIPYETRKASGHKTRRLQWEEVAMTKSTFKKSSFGSSQPNAKCLEGADSPRHNMCRIIHSLRYCPGHLFCKYGFMSSLLSQL
ncbi:hypothetical protein AZF04_06980 [Alkalihalobacillus trypoxylicola]|uniref:Uncharacterized protein n=1 Tax=Alkalihalobacillus trypoxylicola TaxID=519424 RepID=A0A161Q1A6_9BACI|nr:hypothetical protein AZF04_06980 [Alkalihalobacillus trypoxylicola]